MGFPRKRRQVSPSRYVIRRQLKEEYGFSDGEIDNFVRLRVLPFYDLPRSQKRRWLRADVERLLEEGRTPSAEEVISKVVAR